MVSEKLMVFVIGLVIIAVTFGVVAMGSIGKTHYEGAFKGGSTGEIPSSNGNGGGHNGGTNGSGNTGHANVVVQNWAYTTQWSISLGYYADVSMTITNSGTATASNVQVHITVRDQNYENEYDQTHSIGTLASGGSSPLSYTLDYETGDTCYETIVVSWTGGSNSYSHTVTT